MSEETSFYSDEKGVRVTDKRVIVGSTTYALANITSVSSQLEKPNLNGPLTFILLGGVLAVGGIPASKILELSSSFAMLLTIMGIIIAASACCGLLACKPTWHLRITSASGEFTPLSDKDQSRIEGIVRAINEAIVHRA